jgi:hypothetical protein
MAEFAGNAASGLIDLSAISLADLPQIDDETVQVALDRLMSPCSVNGETPATDGRARMWQNYKTMD